MRLCLIAVVGLLVFGMAGRAEAQVQPLTAAPIFTDNAVLQRGRPLSVWGTGAPGSTILVQVAATQSNGIVAPNGTWRVTLPALETQSETNLQIVSGTNQKLTFSHIAIGDVWLCSGQSNMELAVRQTSNSDNEVKAGADPGMRLFLVPRARLETPGEAFAAPVIWAPANPESVGNFSAACYHMGRELRAKSSVPIGLIASSWGGSQIEDWLSEPSLAALGNFGPALDLLDQHRRSPTLAERRQNTTRDRWIDERSAQIGAPEKPSEQIRLSRGPWEEWGVPELADFDGMMRYRGTVTLTPAQVAAATTLLLGQIDDIDRSRINGHLLGTTLGWDTPRRYRLSSNVLKPGRNAIDITVLDTGGGGGLWGSAPRGVELADSSVIPFDDQWYFRAGKSLRIDPPPMTDGGSLASLHNGMIAPLGPYAVRGFVWYQGETNAARAGEYAPLLTRLMRDWRRQFGGTTFVVVQLAGFGAMSNAPARSTWAEIRDVQRRVVEADPAARLVPAIDIGDPYDIHPANKRELGRRLALAVTSDKPRVGMAMRAQRSGAVVAITSNRDYHLQGGVIDPIGFELCSEAGICHLAAARLAAPNRIELSAAPTDVVVHYLWSGSPLVSLFDDDRVPLAPFALTIGE